MQHIMFFTWMKDTSTIIIIDMEIPYLTQTMSRTFKSSPCTRADNTDSLQISLTSTRLYLSTISQIHQRLI